MTDASIVALYWQRREEAVAESERCYGRYCFRVADGILRDRLEAEESVNDTWLAAWNAIPPARPQSLKTFLGALTRRIAISRLRTRSAGKRGGGEALLAVEELGECLPAPWRVETAVEQRELLRALNAFLEGLEEAERTLFVARYWYGLPVAEIAGRLGLRKNTALTRLRRTRLKLRETLETEGLL